MSFLRIEDLHINLGEFYLKDIFFELCKGDYMMIIGPTGAGKTILLESIVGFWPPDKGNIFLGGKDITYELPEKRNIGIVYQDYALLPHFSVFDNIAYGLKKRQKNGLQEKVREMARLLSIEHLLERKPETLSGGEQQRVALARALIVEPELLLMDEPFSALDPQTRREARRLLKQGVSKKNTTVIHISHDLSDAWALANKVAVFRKGEMLQFGAIEEIFTRPENSFIADFVGASILEGIAAKNEAGSNCIHFDGFSLVTMDDVVEGSSVRVALRPEDIIVSRKRPEDISAQNVIEATLKEIVPEGRVSYLRLRVNAIEIPVLVTNNAVEQLNVRLGDTVYAIIKSLNVRVV